MCRGPGAGRPGDISGFSTAALNILEGFNFSWSFVRVEQLESNIPNYHKSIAESQLSWRSVGRHGGCTRQSCVSVSFSFQPSSSPNGRRRWKRKTMESE